MNVQCSWWQVSLHLLEGDLWSGALHIPYYLLGPGHAIWHHNTWSPAWNQAITWTSDDPSSMGPLCTTFNEISTTFIQENAFENAISKMADILFRPQYVKYWSRLVATWVVFCLVSDGGSDESTITPFTIYSRKQLLSEGFFKYHIQYVWYLHYYSGSRRTTWWNIPMV